MRYEQMAAELLRQLRGNRSQVAFCRRLGYRSNVVHQWERGLSWPTAATALRGAQRVGVNVRRAFREFYRVGPRWLDELEPTSPAGVAAFLRDLKGNTTTANLARYSGKSRFAIARWLNGSAEPKLPEFLLMVECCSLRLLDFLEQLVDPAKLPSVSQPWQQLQVARRLAYDEPWSQAVLRALELESYRSGAAHEPGCIATRIGITRDEEERCLALLADAGQVSFQEGHYRPSTVMTLDTRRDPEAARRLRAWWVRVAARRIETGARGVTYNVIGVSAVDLERLRELQKAYLNELRTIVAQSEPVEHVVLAVDALLDLADVPSRATP
ncbi:MAG TPA: DUF4423 domain-containing protein [Polyangiaceae bacterium]|nr:DUF4423 domain-containing protein [Polyangiaceae bacterium]